MNFLIVVSHPDDEVLGAGATIYKASTNSHKVNVCIMCSGVIARNKRPKDQELEDDISNSLNILGVSKIIKGNFPNIEMNNVPHIELVQFIENAMVETEADIVITHHMADLNNDHLHTSLACQEAVRLFQRRENIKPISEFLFMEVVSATDWNLNSSMNQFRANTFIEVGLEGVNKKIEALSEYRGVMRNYPHPRSKEVITGLAAYRGAQSGMMYAEAFECVLRRNFF